MREKIREELPSLFNLFRADAYLLKKIVASAGSLLEEVREDPEHPMRRGVRPFRRRIHRAAAQFQGLRQARREAEARPARPARSCASSRRTCGKACAVSSSRTPRAEKSMIREHLAGMFVEVGRHLAADPQIRADMNQGFVVALASFVESQKSGVSNFIADQVKRWDLGQLTRLIEINIGRDLQYIRFNGMMIGGLAGPAALCRRAAFPRELTALRRTLVLHCRSIGQRAGVQGRKHGQETGIRILHGHVQQARPRPEDCRMSMSTAILEHHRKNLEALEKSAPGDGRRRVLADDASSARCCRRRCARSPTWCKATGVRPAIRRR